jgi:hypothetical protein
VPFHADIRRKDITMNIQESEQRAPMGSRHEAGCDRHDTGDHQHDHRVERDGSWSIYRVFMGIPAKIQAYYLTGPSRGHATEGTLSLNRRN